MRSIPHSVALILAVAAIGGCSGGPDQSTRSRPNVVLVVIDTLRADRLAPYGHGHDTAPFLTQLAERGVLFERAYSTSSWTASATASIFTSTYPSQHQVLTGYYATRHAIQRGFRPNRLPDDLPTLPEVLHQNGYRTYAVADNLNICDAMGFSRGFDHFVGYEYRGAADVNAAVEAVAEDIMEGDAPYFLYLHYMDPHMPYNRREAFYDAAASGDPLFADYDSEIGYVDRHLRELLERLGIDSDTLIVVTSDHGEEFFEHGSDGHHNKLYDELLHVPLIVSWPDRLEPRRVATNVSVIDVEPTILDLVDVAPTGHELGDSLIPIMGGLPATDRTLFAQRWTETSNPPQVRRAVIWRHWKYIWSLPGNHRELYNRQAEPSEKRNLHRQRPDLAGDLHQRLIAFEKDARTYERAYGEKTQLDAELIEKLRALGYTD